MLLSTITTFGIPKTFVRFFPAIKEKGQLYFLSLITPLVGFVLASISYISLPLRPIDSARTSTTGFAASIISTTAPLPESSLALVNIVCLTVKLSVLLGLFSFDNTKVVVLKVSVLLG